MLRSFATGSLVWMVCALAGCGESRDGASQGDDAVDAGDWWSGDASGDAAPGGFDAAADGAGSAQLDAGAQADGSQTSDAAQALDGGTDAAHEADGGLDAGHDDAAQPLDSGSDAARPADGGAADVGPDAANSADGGAADAGPDAASSADGGADAATSADAGSNSAPTLPTKGGTCPDFVSGDANFSPAGVTTRKVRLWVGASGGGPLVIYWHGTGAQPTEAETAGLSGVLAQITAAGGVVAAPYTGANDGTFPWLGTTTESLKVADEIVACAIEKKSIDSRRIHAIGFSAGGLMTSSMSLLRSNYIASVVPYSGGLQGQATFQDASNKFAALIFYGGTTDTFLINFQTTSTSYSAALRANGNYTALCNHGGGHAIPSAGPAAAWRFFQDHHYRTYPSPYVASGLPSSLPSYCQAQP